jgi:serine protease DegS
MEGGPEQNYHGESQERPMMSEEERDRMREELMKLFENNGAPQ